MFFMKYYIIKENEALKIMQVRDEHQQDFLRQYGDCIITVGSSIQEALIAFGEIKDSESGQ